MIKFIIKIGRNNTNDIVVPDEMVTRECHCRILCDDSGHFFVEDRSTNGTFVNGIRIDMGVRHPLHFTDIVKIGRTPLPWRNYVQGYMKDDRITKVMLMDDGSLLEYGQVNENKGISIPPPKNLVQPDKMKVISIGRGSDNDIVINDSLVSRHHLQIAKEGGRYWVVDLGSTNGTYVNGVRVQGRVEIDIVAVVKIGNTVLPWQRYFSIKPKKHKPLLWIPIGIGAILILALFITLIVAIQENRIDATVGSQETFFGKEIRDRRGTGNPHKIRYQISDLHNRKNIMAKNIPTRDKDMTDGNSRHTTTVYYSDKESDVTARKVVTHIKTETRKDAINNQRQPGLFAIGISRKYAYERIYQFEGVLHRGAEDLCGTGVPETFYYLQMEPTEFYDASGVMEAEGLCPPSVKVTQMQVSLPHASAYVGKRIKVVGSPLYHIGGCHIHTDVYMVDAMIVRDNERQKKEEKETSKNSPITIQTTQNIKEGLLGQEITDKEDGYWGANWSWTIKEGEIQKLDILDRNVNNDGSYRLHMRLLLKGTDGGRYQALVDAYYRRDQKIYRLETREIKVVQTGKYNGCVSFSITGLPYEKALNIKNHCDLKLVVGGKVKNEANGEWKKFIVIVDRHTSEKVGCWIFFSVVDYRIDFIELR